MHTAPLTPDRDLVAGAPLTPEGWVRTRVPLAALVADQDVMQAVIDGRTPSDTPDEPVWLRVRDDVVGRYEIADGHHRVADAIRAGRDYVDADIDPHPDDEPYQGPFYDFTPPTAAAAALPEGH